MDGAADAPLGVTLGECGMPQQLLSARRVHDCKCLMDGCSDPNFVSDLRGAEIAFAMGQHHRLGSDSLVSLIEQGLVRSILRREMTVTSASELTDVVDGWNPEGSSSVTLHMDLAPGCYCLQAPLMCAGRICLAPSQGAAEGAVQIVDTPGYPGNCLLAANNSSTVVVAQGISFMMTHGSPTGYTVESNRNFDPKKGQRCTEVAEGGCLALSQCLLHCAGGIGVQCMGESSTVFIKECEMFRCGFAGAICMSRAHLHAVRSSVQWSQFAGFLCKDSSSTAVLKDCTAQFNGTNGVCSLSGSSVFLSRSVLSRNGFSGAVAHGNGSYLSMSDCESTENQHCGASALETGSVYAQKCSLRHSGQAGALALGEGSLMSVLECSADDNLRHGLEARGAAMLIASMTRAKNNGDAGGVVGGASAVLFLQDCVISSNARDGCRAEEGGQAEVVRSLVARSSGSGAKAVGAGSKLFVRGGEVSGNEQDGVAVWEGAEGFAEGCVVELNGEAGVRSSGSGSRVCVVAAVLKRNGVGVAAGDLAHAELRGCSYARWPHPLANDRDYSVESYAYLHTDLKGLASI